MLVLLLVSVLIPLSTQQCLVARDEVRKVNDQAHQSLLQSQLQFSAGLLHTVSSQQPDQNLFFSPTSVFQAVLLAYFLSATHTEKTLHKALYLADNMDKLDTVGAYNLESYYQKLRWVSARGYQLSCTNRLYVAKDVKQQQCAKILFVDDIFPANFEENAKGVVKKINNWIAGQTRHVIKELLTTDMISAGTKLVLVNAAYFKGSWQSQFVLEDTRPRKFQLLNGTKVAIPMMMQESKFRLKRDKHLRADVLELPYVGEQVSMYVVLPRGENNTLARLLNKVDSSSLLELVKGLSTQKPRSVTVSLPKFTMEESLELKSVLEKMGVGDLFQPTADLSTLTKESLGGFSNAIHKAKIRVDEKGTEAAGATAIIMDRMTGDYFTADQPFLYFIFDKASNILLFVGTFVSPPRE